MQTAKSKTIAALEAKGFAALRSEIKEASNAFGAYCALSAIFTQELPIAEGGGLVINALTVISAYVNAPKGADLDAALNAALSYPSTDRELMRGNIPRKDLFRAGVYDALHTYPVLDTNGIIEYINTGGKLAKIKLGKFLGKYAAQLSEKERHHLALEWRKKYAPDLSVLELIPANAPDEWIAAFSEGGKNGATSCMAKDNGYACLAVAGYACADLLPPDLAEKQMNICLALFRNEKGNICARAVVNKNTMTYFPVYGDSLLASQLAAAGFTPSNCVIDGYYIHAGDSWEMSPYLDGHHCADAVTVNGYDFWRVSANGEYALTRTDGGSPIRTPCPCCGEDVHTDDLVHTIVFIDESGYVEEAAVCDDCWQPSIRLVSGDWCHAPNAVRAYDGEWLLDDHDWCANHDYTWSDYCNTWLPYDDAIFSEYYEDYLSESDAVIILSDAGDTAEVFHDADIAYHEQSDNGFYYYRACSIAANTRLKELNRHISQMPENQDSED